MNDIDEISKVMAEMNNPSDMKHFLYEILTASELKAVEIRWKLMKLLKRGMTQRKIALDLNLSLCKITRGAKILKEEDSISNRILNTIIPESEQQKKRKQKPKTFPEKSEGRRKDS